MFLSIVLSLVLSGAVYAQGLGDIETFSSLSVYLESKTGSVVKPSKNSLLSFRIDKERNVATPILTERNPALVHSLFETDVERFIQNSGTADFASAKRKFYQAQSFSESTQTYSRPYVYPSDWHSLNHNPIRKFSLPLKMYGQQFAPLDSKSIEQSPLLGVELHRRLDELTKTEMTAGNKLRFLSNGEISFKEKVRMVKESKRFFHSVVMVQYCDETSSEIIDAMIERAGAGIDVRLFVESVWTNLILKKCLKKLRSGGVKVTLGKGFFNPRTMFTVHHTKFWIRDGEEAIIGGQNMHDFENSSTGFNNQTRDKDVHVVGPAVTDLINEYVRIWNDQRYNDDPTMLAYKALVVQKQGQERLMKLRGTDLYASWLGQEVQNIPGVCRVLVQGTKTSSTPSIISKAYIEILKNVKYNMFIGSPTFRFSEDSTNEYDNSQIIKAILAGGERGVKVDFISNGVDGGWGEAGYQLRNFARNLRRNGKMDTAQLIEKLELFVATLIGRTQRKHLSKVVKGRNIEVWLYFNHIHSKQMMFDNIMTSTGSFNLDKYSYKNNESTMICLDKKLADESRMGFMSDVVNSVPIF